MPELNPELDVAAHAAAFARAGRIQIPAVLTTASAERLHRALSHETPWMLSHNMDGTSRQIPPLAPEERLKLAIQSYPRARDNFAFFYDSHELSRDGEPYPRADHYFAGLVAFLNAPAFIAFLQRVTGMDAIGIADSHATLVQPGDSLTRHDGVAEGKDRLAAYVLSLLAP